MTYVALAELAVILVLVLLLVRAHAAGVTALLNVVSAAELERAELLNAARNPAMMLRSQDTPPAPPREPTEEEKERARNYAKIGTVELPA